MTTVVGPFKRGDNSLYAGRIQFRPINLPGVVGGQAHLDGTLVRIAGSNGLWTEPLQLTPGAWAVYFPSAQMAGPIFLNVPDDAQTWPVSALMVADVDEAATPANAPGAVADLTALRAIPGAVSNKLVWVRSDANGFQRSFWWNDLSTEEDNGVDRIRPDDFALRGRGVWEAGGV